LKLFGEGVQFKLKGLVQRSSVEMPLAQQSRETSFAYAESKDFSPCCYRPLGLTAAAANKTYRRRPSPAKTKKKEKRKHSRSREKKGN
jgi:hypothetical protein